MRRILLCWLPILGLVAIGEGRASDPVEELPPPKTIKSVLANPPATDTTANVDSDQTGWALSGPLGRHYFFDSLAIADYVRDWQRHIVRLEPEAPRDDAAADPNYLSYRESQSGHRWAFARQARADGRFSVYFQAADATRTWLLYQRAEGSFSPTPVLEEAPVVMLFEPTCGRERSE